MAAVQARLTWLHNTEPTLELVAESGAFCHPTIEGKAVTASAEVGEGQEVKIGSATITWRWLPREAWPTIAANSTIRHSSGDAIELLAAELRHRRYEEGAEVGRGGMGKVLEALGKPLRRPVALKVLLYSGQEEDRFIREARVTGRLEHPSIVPVHELNVDQNGRVFYTMKLVKGMTLLRILQDLAERKPEAFRNYPLPALLTIFQKVCDAVAFAHAQSEPVIHRDLKPENIMVGDYGEVFVMDWGAAKILQTSGAAPATVAAVYDRRGLPPQEMHASWVSRQVERSLHPTGSRRHTNKR